jgi:hypothetical protein
VIALAAGVSACSVHANLARPAVRGGRLTHPLPFLGLLVLVFTSGRKPLDAAQWTVIGVYLLYLLPYPAISDYDRYAAPLLGVKVLLVLWGADRLLSFRAPVSPRSAPVDSARRNVPQYSSGKNPAAGAVGFGGGRVFR